MTPAPDIVRDISLLYELALSVQSGEDVRATCVPFVRTLVSRKGLSAASVWLPAGALDPSDARPGDHVRLLDVPPRGGAERTDGAHPLAASVADAPVWTGRSEAGGEAVATAAFRLDVGEVQAGLLVLEDTARDRPFSARELNQLQAVVDRFAASVRAALASERVVRATAEKERALAEVDRLRAFYEHVLEAMPAHLAVFDAEGRYQYVTPSAIADPARRAAVIGKTDAEFAALRGLDPEVPRQRLDTIRSVVDTRKAISFEEAFTDRTGDPRHFVRFVSPVLGADGEVSHVLGYGLDVTEQKRAEAALRESEARYKGLVEHSEDVIYRADLAGRFTYANSVASRVTGYPEADLLGGSFADLVAPEARADTQAFYFDQVTSHVPTTYLEVPIQKADGTSVWLGQNVTLVEEDGAVVGVQAVARDVTERRAVMKALVEAREIAERSSTARQRFLANMSHEMRTPLNGVIGTAELLARTRLDADQRKLLDALQFAADALLALINDILDLTKIDSGKISFERVPFRLGDALHGFADTVRFRAAEKGIRLDLDLHPALPEAVVGDPMRLGQILLNLLSNAVKFTAEGGVRLGVRPGAPGGPLRFVVEDTGIGIAPERLDHVFDRFTQARSDTTRQFGGTGLGLAIVRELAERMGGAVRIESAEGVGTRIEVDLPLDEAPADAVLPDVAVGAEADLTGVRVLLVEDNPLNQFVASEMLEDWGAIVSTAGNGREAVEAVGDGAAPPFDVVLMDVQMPEMDGFEATRRIRARFGPEVLPVVALTASALVEQRAAMQEAGMDDLVVKPFKPAHLRARVAAHVRQAETSEPPAAASVPATPLADAPESDAPESDVPEANASEAAFDDSVLDETFLDEQAGGDPAFRRRMLELFLDPLPETLAALESAAAADDRPAVQAAAHRLKGGAGIIGAHALYEAATALEAAARSEAEAPLGPPVAALAAAAEPAAAAARALLTLAPCSP